MGRVRIQGVQGGGGHSLFHILIISSRQVSRLDCRHADEQWSPRVSHGGILVFQGLVHYEMRELYGKRTASEILIRYTEEKKKVDMLLSEIAEANVKKAKIRKYIDVLNGRIKVN